MNRPQYPTEDSAPRFPIRVVWTQVGEVDSFQDEMDLIHNLEDFYSEDEAFQAEAHAVDALGRSVCLKVNIEDGICEVGLRDAQQPPT